MFFYVVQLRYKIFKVFEYYYLNFSVVNFESKLM